MMEPTPPVVMTRTLSAGMANRHKQRIIEDHLQMAMSLEVHQSHVLKGQKVAGQYSPSLQYHPPPRITGVKGNT